MGNSPRPAIAYESEPGNMTDGIDALTVRAISRGPWVRAVFDDAEVSECNGRYDDAARRSRPGGSARPAAENPGPRARTPRRTQRSGTFAAMTNLDVWYARGPGPGRRGQGGAAGRHAGSDQAEPDGRRPSVNHWPIRRYWSLIADLLFRETDQAASPPRSTTSAGAGRTPETDHPKDDHGPRSPR
jgi:hypothetical protein